MTVHHLSLEPYLLFADGNALRELFNELVEKYREDGTPEQIFDHPVHNRTRAFVNRTNVLPFKLDANGFDMFETEEAIRQFCARHYFSREKEETVVSLP